MIARRHETVGKRLRNLPEPKLNGSKWCVAILLSTVGELRQDQATSWDWFYPTGMQLPAASTIIGIGIASLSTQQVAAWRYAWTRRSISYVNDSHNGPERRSPHCTNTSAIAARPDDIPLSGSRDLIRIFECVSDRWD